MPRDSIRHKYIKGIDGLRTLAVLGVIFYHLTPEIMKGGYLGVPIFFVVTGYLTTASLKREVEIYNGIDVLGFYVKKLKRLYPVLITLLITCGAYITLFDRVFLNNLKGVFLSSLTFSNNWWQIANGGSYFAKFGPESPFSHIWYLAIVGQFYLVWPIIFFLIYRFVKDKKKAGIGLFILSLISGILMAVLFKPGTDPTRVYYGTDTRIFSILMGCGLAFISDMDIFANEQDKTNRFKLNLVGIVVTILLVLSFFTLSSDNSFVYRGGMYLVSLISVVLLSLLILPDLILNRILTNPLFAYIGSRSYGIYLWQFPIMIFFESKIGPSAHKMPGVVILELILILVVSELSYRFVEIPLKGFDFRNTFAKLKEWFLPPYNVISKIPFYISTVVVIIAIVGLVISPSKKLTDAQQKLADRLEANQKKIEANQKKIDEMNKAKVKPKVVISDAKISALMKKYGLTREQVIKGQTMRITAIGDSVMIDIAPDLQEIFPLIKIDGAISRQLYNSYDVVQNLKNKNQLYENVIVELGTNDVFSQAQFDKFYNIIGTKRNIYWVNVFEPNYVSKIQIPVNNLLNENAKEKSNMKVIDWLTLAKKNPSWFWEDKTHPNIQGGKEYAKIVAKAVLED
ncbi:MAG: acetyltransferase [Lachnospiraceae bacterium]|jgi:peptidoglycan/LPS O-acetylase OafA/YrhL|nr:acetyltransferase [Lachnospiraceae bacterium]